MPAQPRARDSLPDHPASRPPADDEARLVAAARADPRAFLPLYDRYYRAVYRFCYGRLGTVEAAEDATQDVFLRALRGLRAYRGDGFAAWLFRIAQRVVAGVYRWRYRHPSEGLDSVEALNDGAPTPEETALRRAEQAAVRASLATLPVDQRLAIELALAGLADAQTAVVLARTPDAVKMLRYRGMKQLKQLWLGQAAPRTESRDD
jgi:RNA polymerase sigma-70 factor, ECF subfamily